MLGAIFQGVQTVIFIAGYFLVVEKRLTRLEVKLDLAMKKGKKDGD